MGIKIGLVAIQARVPELEAALMAANSEWKLVSSADGLQGVGAYLDWDEKHGVFVASPDWSPTNRGTTVYGLWQDGPWAIVADSQLILPADEGVLGAVSRAHRRVISAIAETAFGSARFSCWDRGAETRSISRDGDAMPEFSGQPLPEERGIDTSDFFIDEAEQLWRAFGLSSFGLREKTRDIRAICIEDQTDYAALREQRDAAPVPRKPWWKLW